MSAADRRRWDERYRRRLDNARARGGETPVANGLQPPGFFASLAHLFPTSGSALDVACGLGGGALWLAERGLSVTGWDVSPVAIAAAADEAERAGLTGRCRFEVVDLEPGLPDGPPVDVILCNCYRQTDLYSQFVERLNPGGILAIAVLSEVDGEAGDYSAEPGELATAFAALDVLASNESSGVAILVGRQPGPSALSIDQTLD